MSQFRRDFHEFLKEAFDREAPVDETGSGKPFFVRDDHVKAWAGHHGLRVPDALVELVRNDVWPERFRRNVGVYTKEQMIRILETRVAIAGLGGLGGHVAEYLARLGFCRFTLCDMDDFAESNLNRQAFCTLNNLGRNKAAEAGRALTVITDYLEPTVLGIRLNGESVPGFLEGADLVFDCLDDIGTKMLLENACADAGIPFVHGGVSYLEGFAFAERGELGLKRLYGETPPPKPDSQPVSVLAVAGTACLMVSLGLKLLFEESWTSGSKSGKGAPPTLLTPLHHIDCGEPGLSVFEFDRRQI